MQSRSTRRSAIAVLAPVLAFGLAACGPDQNSATGTTTAPVTLPTSDAKGGALQTLSLGPVDTWDPQRIASREDAAFAGRVFLRTLTTYEAAPDAGGQKKLVGDLASDTGVASADLRSWTFTLRPGVKWQDASALTCADIKYGISRSFASQIAGGPGYPKVILDIPKTPTGLSIYTGPYDTSAAAAAGKAAFDKAVTCTGNKITFRLAVATSDFNEMVSLPTFAPYQAKTDKRDAGTHVVQSLGPYMLQGTWQSSVGGTFVRNPNWASNTDPVRRALPDTINYREGVETPQAVQDIMADADGMNAAVALDPAPPALQQQISAAKALQGRTINPNSSLIDYLAPNWQSPTFKEPAARRALALATNREGYVNALGGPLSAAPVTSLIPTSIRATAPAAVSTAVPSADAAPTGSATATTSPSASPSGTASSTPTSTASTPAGTATGAAAVSQQLLRAAGLTPPVRITVAYRQSETADKAMAALAAGWRAGGFEPVLTPIADDYFGTISAPAAKTYDVFWSNWAPEYASASTILPPLFDSRLNLTTAGTGRDYGYVADNAANAEMTRINAIVNRDDREAAWAALDSSLIQNVAYIGLAERRSMYVAGSAVRNFGGNSVAGGFVEFADLGVR